MHSIGTETESSLHRALKNIYKGKDGRTEVKLEGYICDAVRKDGVIIEIQTGSFGPIKTKLETLCETHKVRLVHPIIAEKYIELYNKKGELVSQRKSPKKLNAWDIFRVLGYAINLVTLKNLTIELAMVSAIETRIDDGKGSYHRKGKSIKDKVLCELLSRSEMKYPKDYKRFVPFKKGTTFTVQEFAKKAEISMQRAQRALYVLSRIGITPLHGKKGHKYVYIVQ
ncbi:MAG: hypothetical protein LBM77_11845 [Spirochaetaceae bacterium]|jgi:hypothetical protein|nr:hypothetical protein [Spirochaetaceae bacterium]